MGLHPSITNDPTGSLNPYLHVPGFTGTSAQRIAYSTSFQSNLTYSAQWADTDTGKTWQWGTTSAVGWQQFSIGTSSMSVNPISITGGTSGQYLGANSSNVSAWQNFTPPTIQRFTSTGAGTYHLPVNPSPIYLICTVLGGGGSGSSTSAVNPGGGGGGAGAGGYARFLVTSPVGSYPYFVGGAGTSSSFGSTFCNGGGGGSSPSGATAGAGGLGGTFSVVTGTAILTSNGGAGAPGETAVAGVSQGAGGSGGASALGGSGLGGGPAASTNGGNGAANSGGGGGGASAFSATGGTGGAGVVVIEEYYV